MGICIACIFSFSLWRGKQPRPSFNLLFLGMSRHLRVSAFLAPLHFCFEFLTSGSAGVVCLLYGIKPLLPRACTRIPHPTHPLINLLCCCRNFTFKCHRNESDIYAVNSMEFNPTFGTFATAGSDGCFHFWDKDTKQRLKAMPRSMYGTTPQTPAPITCR